jgi:hypothetical protein
MPPTDDRDTTAERFRELARTAEIRTPARLLPSIIRCRETIADLRRRGADWPGIASLLADVGIRISPGTLRNYQARIDRAVACLAAETPGTPPSPEDIDALCRRLARTAAPPAAPAPPRPRHSPEQHSPEQHRPQQHWPEQHWPERNRPDPAGPTATWAAGELIRDDDPNL